MLRRNLKEYSDEMLIELCKPIEKWKDIPLWLYSELRRRKIQKEATAHMRRNHPLRTYEEVEAEARKYEYRGEFQKHSSWAYQWAKKHGVLDKVCAHMKPKSNAKKRCLYLITFDDNFAYLGITWNTADRWHRHMHPSKNEVSPVYIHHIETGLEPHFEQISEYMSAVEASELEKKLIKEYAQKWKMLNTSVGGELGSIHNKWSWNKVLKVVKICQTYKDFQEHTGAYEYVRRNGLIQKIQELLPREREVWTEEHIREVLGNCRTLLEARKKYPTAINAAKAMGIYKEIEKSLTRLFASPYTEKQIREFVKTLTYKDEFAKKNRSMVNAAKAMGIYDELVQNLPVRPRGKSLEEYKALARPYRTRKDFKNDHPGAYAVILGKGWGDECFAHMEYLCRVNLTNEEILKSAATCGSISEWQDKDGGAYNAAKARGIFELATRHMRRPDSTKISDSYLINLCAGYSQLNVFRKEHPNEYAVIVRRGKDFFERCTGHMKRRKHFYTKDEAVAIAKQFPSRMALNKANLSVYTFLYTRGLLDECFPKS